MNFEKNRTAAIGRVDTPILPWRLIAGAFLHFIVPVFLVALIVDTLREAEARAHQQTSITESELSITVQENQGKAALKRATQDAEQTRTLTKAEADRIRLLGEGEAAKTVALAGADPRKEALVNGLDYDEAFGVDAALAAIEQPAPRRPLDRHVEIASSRTMNGRCRPVPSSSSW